MLLHVFLCELNLFLMQLTRVPSMDIEVSVWFCWLFLRAGPKRIRSELKISAH